MVVCLERGADCFHVVQLMPLHPQTPSSLASFRSRLVLPFRSQLTQVVLVKETVVLNQARKLVLQWFLQLFVAARFCIVCVQL